MHIYTYVYILLLSCDYICDWIYENWSKSHKNSNPFYCLTLKLHSSTAQTYQAHAWLKMAKSAFTEGLLPTL